MNNLVFIFNVFHLVVLKPLTCSFICFLAGYLTDENIINITRRITNRSHLRNLAHTLGVSPIEVDIAITNSHGDVTETSYAVVQGWFLEQESRESAYLKMKDALRKSGLDHIATDIFGTNDERQTDPQGIWILRCVSFHFNLFLKE